MKSIAGKMKKNRQHNQLQFRLGLIAFINLFFYTSAADPFNTPKLVLLLILTSALLLPVFEHIPRISLLKLNLTNLTMLAPIMFITSMFISAIFSKDLTTGLFGELQRRLGWTTYLCLVILYIYISRFINIKNSLLIYKISIINNLILSTYCLLQFTGNDFVSWNNPYNSIIGTLGNPNFASASLAILSVMSLASITIPGISTVLKCIAGGSSIIAIICIVLSDSLQGLVVLFLAIGIYLTILLLKTSVRFGKIFLVMFSGTILLMVSGMLQKGPLSALLYKPSVTLRGYYWDAGISMFKNNPLLGVGVDQYGDFFREYRKLEYPLKYGFEIGTTNSHNVFIQYFATGGVFVGLSYLILCLIIFYCGISLIKQTNKHEFFLVLGIFTTWIGFQAQSIVSIDNIGLTVWGWLLGSSIVGMKINHELSNDSLDQKFIKRKKNNNFALLSTYLFLFPILITSLYLTKSELETFELTELISRQTFDKQIIENRINGILNNPLAHPSYKLYAIRVKISIQGNESNGYELEKLSEKYPRNSEIIFTRLNYAIQMQDFDEQIYLRKVISKNDPWNLENYLQLVTLYSGRDNLVEAKKVLSKMIKLSSASEQTKLAQTIVDNK